MAFGDFSNFQKLFFCPYTTSRIMRITHHDRFAAVVDLGFQTLEVNRDFTVEYIRENIPEISVWSPEGTYLLWLDCSKLNLENDELNQFFLEKAKVKMNPGYRFGAQCSTYMRLNIGCPRAQLKEALARIEKESKTASFYT